MLYINIRPGNKGTVVVIVTYGTTRYRRLGGICRYIIGYVVARCAVMRMAVKVLAVTRITGTAAVVGTGPAVRHCCRPAIGGRERYQAAIRLVTRRTGVMNLRIGKRYRHASVRMTRRAVHIRCDHRCMISKTDAAACTVMTVGAGGAASCLYMMRIYRCGRRCYIMTGGTEYG